MGFAAGVTETVVEADPAGRFGVEAPPDVGVAVPEAVEEDKTSFPCVSMIALGNCSKTGVSFSGRVFLTSS